MSDAGIQLIVGLGNPGTQYEATRHNVGFWWVEAIALAQGESFRAEPRFLGELARVCVAGRDVRLLKPSTYMNRSGQSVVAVAHYFDIPPERILIAHDELDLPVGVTRLKQGGGHAGHNGLRDSISALGSREFWRLRIGIAHPGDRSLVTGYVLGCPSRDDEQRIRQSLEEAEHRLPELIEGQFQQAMNRLHRQG
ncbi:aminoacyl-tRNA hydrolase [Thermochromatium tepidum]|jgi:peptidyl-tRNA hydrolase (EC 3.1.1.29)|uniref:Peptidyl-tRNA hydrolase n=1 Tax=Thermochromatium tepidum ATCC 43061 TaxID=316276 RepID=A0A6I6EBG0_THETI|nr:aminoacyl-tRNA hydrolase [Thermochromatium tepidum]QGU33998.1 aminoacyl-tRNA hydrolase [Thermochromatium tepidum ATCC 43061]